MTAKIIYEWANSFHNTRAKSTINGEEAYYIDYRYYAGDINSQHKDHRRLSRLRNALCPHNQHECSCMTMSGVA